MTTFSKPQLVPELVCSDAKVSKEFYVNVLGFSVVYERIDHGFYYLARDGVEIMLEQRTQESWLANDLDPPYGRGMHFQITINDVKGLHRRCLDANAQIYRDLEEAWYRADKDYVGQLQFVVLDPDGYMLRFAEFLGKRGSPPATGRTVA